MTSRVVINGETKMASPIEFTMAEVDNTFHVVITRQTIMMMKLACYENPQLDAKALVELMEEMLDKVEKYNG